MPLFVFLQCHKVSVHKAAAAAVLCMKMPPGCDRFALRQWLRRGCGCSASATSTGNSVRLQSRAWGHKSPKLFTADGRMRNAGPKISMARTTPLGQMHREPLGQMHCKPTPKFHNEVDAIGGDASQAGPNYS